MAEVASVRIRISDLVMEWLEAVAELLSEIDATPPGAMPDAVADRAAAVREVMFRNAQEA